MCGMQNKFSLPRPGAFCRLVMGASLLFIVILGVLLEAPLGLSSIAHADGGGPEFGLQPVLYDPSDPLTKSYFIFDSKAGVVLKSRVRVTNVGTARGSVSLYTVDATTGQTSGAVYLNRNDPRNDVGAWVTLGMQHLTLDPGQSKIVSFQVNIPSSVRPGQHLGGIVAENLTQLSSTPASNANGNTGTFQIKVKNLTIIAVQVNLPGTPVEQMAATAIQAGGQNGYQNLLLGLSNTGTVMLKPYGSLQVTDAQGQSVVNQSLRLDTFLPQTAINYPVYIKGPALVPGDYQAVLTLMYGHNQFLHYTTKFSITQQQVTQVFSSPQTQPPLGLPGGDLLGLPLWVVILAGGGLILLLLLAGNILLAVSRSRGKVKRANVHGQQFKQPGRR